ncbi:hypothetical protein CCACVL1_01493 [Corchorus capsularis]|uniref:AIPP2-like SPOC-like domain-containing protein n=1 Tax=Corchorus capsularis TaxID=210143 RepID=A0A1R3KHQ1_COCAP|nr:hypothetical protein CCACVL1_01493 [Corchorus capsularis]
MKNNTGVPPKVKFLPPEAVRNLNAGASTVVTTARPYLESHSKERVDPPTAIDPPYAPRTKPRARENETVPADCSLRCTQREGDRETARVDYSARPSGSAFLPRYRETARPSESAFLQGDRETAYVDCSARSSGSGEKETARQYCFARPSRSRTYHHPIVPAMERIWRGTFEILDHIDITLQGLQFCEEFSAYPASTVSHKAYMFTKQIANVIQFRLCELNSLCHEIFKTDPPSATDIALYFYATDNKTSKVNYSTLLKLMNKNKLMLKSRMGSAELLVFSSKFLPTEFKCESH